MKSILVLLLVSSSVAGQSIKLMSGDLRVLKGQKSYSIIFQYDNMLIGTGIPERAYLAEKRKQWELKEEGYGEEFVSRWFQSRADFYEPTFTSQFTKYSKVRLDDRNARYTLILKTQRTEGGWDGGVIGHPGEIDGLMLVVESANLEKVVATIRFKEIPGKSSNGGDFEMINRIRLAYQNAGKGLGMFFKRKTK